MLPVSAVDGAVRLARRASGWPLFFDDHSSARIFGQSPAEVVLMEISMLVRP